MTDNIKPEHYRTGEIDLFEEWYLTYPFEQYRAIMQSHAEKYLRRNKVNRVEDLDKSVETIRRLKEKEIEHAKGKSKKVYDKGVSVLWADNEPVEQEPLYYAKIKGWEVLGKRSHWIYLKNLKEFIIGVSSVSRMEIDVMTKEEWNALGINDANADFERVE